MDVRLAAESNGLDPESVPGRAECIVIGRVILEIKGSQRSSNAPT